MAFATHAEMLVFERSINERFDGLEARGVESIRVSVAKMGEQITSLVAAGWTAANTEFQREQETVRTGMQQMKEALELTSESGLLEAAAKIKAIDADRELEKVRLDILLRDIRERCEATAVATNSKIAALEHSGPRAGGDYDGASTNNSRAPRLRVPDPSGWKLKEMAGKGDSWGMWREAFELQVGSIWPGLDQMLMKIRDISHETRIEKVHYDREVNILGLNDSSLGMNPADWQHGFVSQKLFMVIFSHIGPDAKKIIQSELNGRKDGFEAYRLLNREYDPACDDLESTLLERVTSIASWKITGIDEESAALREASTRIEEMERRLNRGGGVDGPNRDGAILHEAMKTMITGMFYARVLSPSTKAYLMHKDRERTFRRDFFVMKTLVDELKRLNENLKPRKMDISSAAAASAEEYSHVDWVAWMESDPGDDQWPAEHWPEEEWPAESYPPSLDAVYGGGKGKGKKGKGKGKGKGDYGLGKGKGKDSKGKGKGKGKQGEWIELRSCHNCGATGDKFHFARECQLPPRARANYVADAGAAGPPAGAVGHSALIPPGASEPVARRTFASCVARTSLPVFSAPSVYCGNPALVRNRYASLFMMRANSPTHVDGSTVVRARGDPVIRRPHLAQPVIDIDDEMLCGLCES